MHKRRIYVASSWRNVFQQQIVAVLREWGHEVYDFKNPPGRTGFAWSQCHEEIKEAFRTKPLDEIESYLAAMETSAAKAGFASDKAALDWCDTCVLVLPCGRSAHLEAGYTAGQGKDTYFLLHPENFKPELMYALGTGSTGDLSDIFNWMNAREPGSVARWHELSGGHFKTPANHAIRLLREVVELCFATGSNYHAMSAALFVESEKHLNKILAEPVLLNPGECGLHSYLLADESCTCQYSQNFTASEIAEEWADCAILLEIFRNYASIDGHTEIRKKLDVLYKREWQADAGGALHRLTP